nr:MAG TPA: hypothetical protein [Caudoviricetes sp.]
MVFVDGCLAKTNKTIHFCCVRKVLVNAPSHHQHYKRIKKQWLAPSSCKPLLFCLYI